MNSYSRPDVTARREEDFGRKMALEGEPARVAGEASVRAAGEAGSMRNLREAFGLERKAQNAQDLQSQKDIAMAARLAQTGQNQGALAQIKNLLKQRKTGMFGIGGNAAETDAQILALQGGGATGGAISMVTPDGRHIQVPESDIAEAESMGARRQ